MSVHKNIAESANSSLLLLLEQIYKLQSDLFHARCENALLKSEVQLLEKFTKYSVKEYLRKKS